MIARMGKTRFIVCATLVLVVCAALIAVALGLNLPEATGKTVKKDGKMTVDCSNMSEGYLMVKAKKTSKRLKLQIATSGAKLNYDLNSDGEYEVFRCSSAAENIRFPFLKMSAGRSTPRKAPLN
jgi:hypothetical protein